MSWTNKKESVRSIVYAVSILAIAITMMWGGAQLNTITTVEASGGGDAPSATFPGIGTGAIPDNTPAGLNVTFNVTGITGTPTDIWVSMDLTHSFMGDVDVKLTAPNGTSHVIFASTGATTAAGFGDSSDLLGVYRFIDSATGPNWWAAAAAAGVNEPIPPGDYRTTQPGPQATVNTSPVTSINAAFAGVTTVNGTWTLNVSDNANLDTGSINAATLNITAGTTPPAAPAKYLDFFGNNLTDFAIFTLPTGGQITYRVTKNENPTTATSPILDQPWGQSTTELVPNQGNYIGDARTDFNVYRNNNGSPANYYLIAQNDDVPSKTTAFINWGNGATDIIGAEGDYNGDGLLDPTVVRPSGNSLIWYILNSGSNTVTSFQYGLSADIPLPGANYTGSAAADPTVARTDSNGQITWIVGNTSGGVVSLTPWGNFSTDFIIPGGDYDGDGFADLMVWRGFGAGTNGVWYMKGSAGSSFSVPFGIPGDGSTRDIALRGGDYDGDNKADIAVWRSSSNTFYVLRSTNGGSIIQNISGVSGNANIPIAAYGTY